MSGRKNNRLINEEQQKVNDLIDILISNINDFDEDLKKIVKDYEKAREIGPDAYGMLVDSLKAKSTTKETKQRAQMAKDGLYSNRIVLDVEDDDGTVSKEELKIGLHKYVSKGKILIHDWKEPVCRHYQFQNSVLDFEGEVTDSQGYTTITKFHLIRKLDIKMKFSQVYNVLQLYPLKEEEIEQLLFDEFLNELVERRDNVEFRNIVFSIQQKQTEIVTIPFEENLIVQGCAGSGKSMIMLHRLPILLYDNPNSIDKNNLYIISPSETYIQMADEIRKELEISELKMGTLIQYFEYIISKYGVNPEVYGKINYRKKLSREIEQYVYSKKLIEDINGQIHNMIFENDIDLQTGYSTLNITSKYNKGITPEGIMRYYILEGNNIVNTNSSILKEYFQIIRRCIGEFRSIAEIIRNRKKKVINNLTNQIDAIQSEVDEKEEDLKDSKLDEKAKENRKIIIKILKSQVTQLEQEKQDIEEDEYFDELISKTEIFKDLFAIYKNMKINYEEHKLEDIYSFIEHKNYIFETYNQLKKGFDRFEEKYQDYVDSIKSKVHGCKDVIDELKEKTDKYLDKDYVKKLVEDINYYNDLTGNIVEKLYAGVMTMCDQKLNQYGKFTALECTPYIYLQILYLVKGVPNAAKERLISIDEAQNISLEELRLIKNCNDENLIFNLYGDEKQHIEGTKGINSWNEYAEIVDVKPKQLRENYRNAKEITEECNKQFGMNMTAINVEGNGVHIIDNQDELIKVITELLNVNIDEKLKAIIVKNEEEAKWITRYFKEHNEKIKLIGKNESIDSNCWNVISVEQAKGLEFKMAIILSGQMTANEKYIAYTRAMEELYICAFEVDISKRRYRPKKEDINKKDKADINLEMNNTVHDIEPMTTSFGDRILKEFGIQDLDDLSKDDSDILSLVKDEDERTELHKFFEDSGFEVIDMRSKGGCLWIVGEKEELAPYMKEARRRFWCKGIYGSGKATGYRQGCYYKSRK